MLGLDPYSQLLGEPNLLSVQKAGRTRSCVPRLL